MTDDNSPFKPPSSAPVDLDLIDKAEPRSHWFIRVMVMFLGSTMAGMALALIWIVPGTFLSFVGLGVLAFGIILIRAGIMDRPPSLQFLKPTPRPPRQGF